MFILYLGNQRKNVMYYINSKRWWQYIYINFNFNINRLKDLVFKIKFDRNDKIQY